MVATGPKKIRYVENRCFSKQKKRMKAIKQNFVIEHKMGMVSCGHVIGEVLVKSQESGTVVN